MEKKKWFIWNKLQIKVVFICFALFNGQSDKTGESRDNKIFYCLLFSDFQNVFETLTIAFYMEKCVANLGNWSILVYIFCITRTTQILKLSNLQKRLFSPNFKAKFCSRKCWTQNYSNRMIFSEWMNSVNLKFTMFNTSIELNIKVVSINLL